MVGAIVADEGRVNINKFDGKDFDFWNMQIEDYLYQKEQHEPLLRMMPAGMKQADWGLLYRQALRVVHMTLAKNVTFNIMNEKTMAGLMEVLSNMYEKPSVLNKVYLMRRLFNLKMAECASVADHINEFNVITTQLSYIKIDFDDEIY